MSITDITSKKFLSDTIKYVRDDLNDNITDPIPEKRGAGERFVMTSYPERKVSYPIITVKDAGVSDIERMGMQSEIHWLRIPIEVRIWARNVKEKDEMFEEVYTRLRTNQFDGFGNSVGVGLNGFSLTSAVNVDEPGKGGVKSKVMEIEYSYITED